MNILVTGASGLVGNAICKWFLNKGHKVTGVVNSSQGKINHDNYRELSIDLTKELTTLQGEKYSSVIHCAAIIPKNTQEASNDELEKTNHQIDHSVFNFSKTHNLKLIYFSTSFFYDPKEVGSLSESAILDRKVEGYYKSKQNSEKFLGAEFLDSVILRISSPYGNLAKQNNVVKVFAESIKNNLAITLINKGERKQNFIHTDDIAEACHRILKNNATGIYNLAYKENYTMLELAAIIKKIYNSNSEFNFDISKSEHQQNINFDISKIKKALNWEPSTDLYSGLLKTLNS